MLFRVDADAPATVHLQAHAAIVGDGLDGPQLPVRHLRVIRRRSELNTVAHRERLFLLLVAYRLAPARSHCRGGLACTAPARPKRFEHSNLR